MNKKGEIVIPRAYDHATPFSDGLACVSNLIELGENNISYDTKIIDVNGNVLYKFRDYIANQMIFGFQEGILILKVPRVTGYIDVLKYINKQGKVIFKTTTTCRPKSGQAGCYEGLIPIISVNGNDYEVHVIDKTGKKIMTNLTKKYNIRQIFEFKNGLAVFCTFNGDWGYIDKNGEVVVKGFDKLSNFENGYALAGMHIYNEKPRVIRIDSE